MRPQNLTGQFQYLETGNDTASIQITFTKWNPTFMMRDYIGVGVKLIPASSLTSWTNFSIPITYISGSYPDSALIMMSSNEGLIAANYVVNDYLYVDNLAFSGNVPAGIDENTMNNQITISPNPANGVFTISATGTKIKEVRVMDVTGRIVNSEQLIFNCTSTAIDMIGYAKGIYFVRIEDEQKNVVNRKIVLQ